MCDAPTISVTIGVRTMTSVHEVTTAITTTVIKRTGRPAGIRATTRKVVIPVSGLAGMTRTFERPYVIPPPFLMVAQRLPTRDDYGAFL